MEWLRREDGKSLAEEEMRGATQPDAGKAVEVGSKAKYAEEGQISKVYSGEE